MGDVIRRRALLLAAVGVTTAVVAALPGTARPAYPGQNGRIAFVSDRDDYQGDIYTMNADGNSVTRCARDGMRDNEPAWSPNGTRIAFESQRDNPFGEIYVMNADTGNNVTRITDTAGSRGAAWSPDGKKI